MLAAGPGPVPVAMRERFEARQKLALLPPDANPNRIRNRGRGDGKAAGIHPALWPFAHFVPGNGAGRVCCPASARPACSKHGLKSQMSVCSGIAALKEIFKTDGAVPRCRLTTRLRNMLTRIRNAIHSRHQTVLVPQSKIKTVAIADILKAQGYIRDWDLARNQKFPTMRNSPAPTKKTSTNAIRGLKRSEQARPAGTRWARRDSAGVRRVWASP